MGTDEHLASDGAYLRRVSGFDAASGVRNWNDHVKYLTDGYHLYEVASQRIVQNFGLRRGTIGYTIVRDCISGATATLGDLDLAALSNVSTP